MGIKKNALDGVPPAKGKKGWDAEWSVTRQLNQRDIEITINKYLHAPMNSLREILKKKDLPAVDAMIIGIIIKAVDSSDAVRLEFILSRLVGKVKQEVSVNANVSRYNYNVDVNAQINLNNLSIDELEALEKISKKVYGETGSDIIPTTAKSADTTT